MARTLLFVVDKSGSMSGAKMEQARDGLRFLVRQLRPLDTFNIIAYESRVTLFRPELQVGDAASQEAALQWIDGLYAGGGTAIDGALQGAFQLATDPKRPTFVVFLTDGLPTVGEVQELKIAQNARQANQVRGRLFPFGVGFDVNARLLDRLAADHRGAASYVRPNENIEAGIAALYNRIGSPLLTDLQLEWKLEPGLPAGAAVVNRTYPKQLTDLYRGEQLVYVGRYRQPGKVRVTLSGVRGAERVSLDAEGELAAQSPDDSLIFVERLWATRRIGELIEQLDLEGRNPELIDELVQLSLRHGILTPYTSFLAEEATPLGATTVNRRETMKRLEEGLRRESGESGVEQRAFKGNLQRSTALPAAGAAVGLGGGQKQELA
ncbi:MAG: VWA domain-containing protein, partial [Planctomycetaceae bacterium]